MEEIQIVIYVISNNTVNLYSKKLKLFLHFIAILNNNHEYIYACNICVANSLKKTLININFEESMI